MTIGTRVVAALSALTLAGLALAGCSTPATPGASGSASTSASTAAGFPADATIGVSLPWLGTQNWAEGMDQFTSQLQAAGFKPLVQQADNKVPQQQSQIEAMIEQGAKVIVVAPIDGSQLGSVLDKAKAAGVTIIGYDRLIQNTKSIDAIVQYGSVEIGRVQGRALLEGLGKLKGAGPYNIELFAGGPADPNAPNFFKGAMEILQPKIDDGTIKIVSGQTKFEQAATLDWDNAKAQARMDTLLSGFYPKDVKLDGVLSPNDGIARAIITSCKQAGKDIPVVDGLDAENESIVSIWKGEQYQTTDKATKPLVEAAVKLVIAAQKGEAWPAPTSKTNNGKIDVPLYELTPVSVTKDNIKDVYKDDPKRLELLK
ncbi:Multiple sugar-binding periplasmic receptor ChvE [Propionicimonas sp. T2.31MG-18]|uniref:substrate-binding domain-containing protein n=1 Tax=Propionicimonas sp. T2.31MG-18 TaxID=3157620 RepID=UPI0035EF6994